MTHALVSRNAGIPLKYANRHGLVTGQTGTGKTVTLQRLAEQFSLQGVPVFISDVKGDIAALSRSCPVTFLDCFGQSGKRLSVTVGAMGADLMARAMDLSDTQSACLEIAFAYATDARLRLDTLQDLRDLLAAMLANRERVSVRYGQVSGASVGVIQRAILRLEAQGGAEFFRAPCFDVADLMSSPGSVSILDSVRLINSPRVYAAFLLFLLSDLWNRLPEIGDTDKPRLVLFFDESHLLFQNVSSHLLARIEQTVRLIRSKGVGVYFVTQSPDDVPPMIRLQLAHKIGHDRSLPVGAAILETMDSAGRPVKPQRVSVCLPDCPLGALAESERPETPVSVETAAGDQAWLKMHWPEALLLLVVVAMLAGSIYGLWLLWGKPGLGLAGLVVAGLLKAR